VDEMLALIDPKAPRAYWDFMIDHQYGEAWTEQSPIYADDWFGSINNNASDGFRPSGRFRAVKSVYDPAGRNFSWARHNPYGYLGHETQVNGAEFLQRSNNFCGFENTQVFANANKVVACFENNSASLLDWDLCIEVGTQSPLCSLCTLFCAHFAITSAFT
jgi:hypothetical protein